MKSPASLVSSRLSQMQLQLINSGLNRIPAVNGNYYKELQGIGIIGSLKKKNGGGKKKVGQDQHDNYFKKK